MRHFTVIPRLLSVLVAALIFVPPSVAQEQRPAAIGEYRLQPGDEIAVSVLPQKDYDCSGAVLPDGKLNLKNVGELQVSGITVAELRNRIRAVLEKELVDPEVTVTVTKLGKPVKQPQVTVTGAVVKPGPLDLEPGLRLSKALELAGGPKPEANLKEVQIVHDDLKQTLVDLSKGENVLNPLLNRELRDGDSVIVPLQARKITVSGAVAKPGPQDLTEGLRVRQVLDLAGGVVEQSDLTRVTVVHRDLTRQVVDLSTEPAVLDPQRNLLLQDGDMVEVALLFKKGFATITGAVQKPGTYELKPGWTLDNLIVAADQLKVVADVESIQLRRGGKTQTINLQKQAVEPQLVLEPGDEILVPEFENKVVLIAPVQTPGLRPLRPGQTIQQFFTQTSLAQEDALKALDSAKVDLRGVRVIREGTEPLKVDLAAVLGNPKHKNNLVLESGDVIYLPPRDPRDRDRVMRQLPWVGNLLSILLLRL